MLPLSNGLAALLAIAATLWAMGCYTIEFLFDFASPNVYLADRAPPPILKHTGATLELTPCMLDGGRERNVGEFIPTASLSGRRE